MGCLPKFFAPQNLIRRRSVSQDVAAARDDASGETPEKDCDTCCAKEYNWNDVERLTMDFSRVIGSGGFSTVFLAHLPSSTFAAVKIHGASDHLNRLFRQELDILRQLRHDNIVNLLGYCEYDQERSGALVLEYLENGNLHDNLHRKSSQVLPWNRRMAIAFQLAQALEYLHEKCTFQIVHGDIKASNILLDGHLNCKLCDFGSAKKGFSSMVILPSSKQVIMGSPGYTDPHYLRTGVASKKNDIYSYGVILLELVTGIEACLEESGELLTSIMGPTLRDARECEVRNVASVVDPKLAGDFELNEARALLSLAARCLGRTPVLRPSASLILQDIRENISSI